MAKEIVMPALEIAQDTGTLIRWLKAEGDLVSRGEPLMEIETDKVVVEVAAPADGTMGEIRVKEGEPANPGDLLCTLITGTTGPTDTKKTATKNETPLAATPAKLIPRANGDGRAKLSPAVRNRLLKYQIDAALVTGSGKNGRITVQDVETY